MFLSLSELKINNDWMSSNNYTPILSLKSSIRYIVDFTRSQLITIYYQPFEYLKEVKKSSKSFQKTMQI